MDCYIRMETHLHTAEISTCSHVPAKELIAKCYEAGYGAIVVTDHFIPGKFVCREDREQFLQGYRNALDEGDRLGVKVLPGMEIRFASGLEDFLVYGMEEEEILNLPDDVCNMTLSQFHSLCQDNGWLIFQAHPFRSNMRVQPAEHLDGIEVFNGNPRHNSHNELAMAYAIEHDLLMMFGSDVHEYGDIGATGIMVPRQVLNPKAFAQYLQSIKIPMKWNI